MRTKIEERIPFKWEQKERLLKETGGKCAHCGDLLDRYTNLTMEHVIPLNKGGTNDESNLTVLCDNCNKEKSDMILPVSWYTYLGPKKRKTLKDEMTAYMAKTDYLSTDCLLPVDAFRIEIPAKIEKDIGNGRIKRIQMPVYVKGMRMEMDDAFAWLKEYRRSLQHRDWMGTIAHPSEWPAPCYLLKKGNTEMAMVNPWMIHEWNDRIGNYRNEIILDWFFAPDLPQKDYLPTMLIYLINGMVNMIAGNLSKTMGDNACAVLLRIRCFLSDRFCNPVFDLMPEELKDQIIEFLPKNAHMTARIREIAAFQIVGGSKACLELRKKLDKEHPDHMADMREIMKENAHLNERLENTTKQPK